MRLAVAALAFLMLPSLAPAEPALRLSLEAHLTFPDPGPTITYSVPSGKTIYPGARMSWPNECTVGFIVWSADDGHKSFVTAGHCVDYVGQRVEIGGVAIGTVEAMESTEVGEVVMPEDWAMVRIDSAHDSKVYAALPSGGPCRQFDNQPVQVPVEIYGTTSGYSVGLHEAATNRVVDVDQPFIYVAPAVRHGDSGAPVVTLDSKAAVGINIAGLYTGDSATTHLGTRLSNIPYDNLLIDPNCSPSLIPDVQVPPLPVIITLPPVI